MLFTNKNIFIAYSFFIYYYICSKKVKLRCTSDEKIINLILLFSLFALTLTQNFN